MLTNIPIHHVVKFVSLFWNVTYEFTEAICKINSSVAS